MLVRLLAAALCTALAAGPVLADSVAGPVDLAPTANCNARADVAWSFTFTQNPQREFGRITNLAGTDLGSFNVASTLSSGSYSGQWRQDIRLPQPDNTLIGSYGGAGDNPPSAAHTAEFFVLYNCTTRRVLYACSGNLGTCPQTAAQGLARISEPIPASSPAALAAMLLALAASGALALRGARAGRSR